MNKLSIRAAISLSVFVLLSVAVIATETGSRPSVGELLPATSPYEHAPLIIRWVSVVRRIRDSA